MGTVKNVKQLFKLLALKVNFVGTKMGTAYIYTYA